ncbi:fumarylacetoacetase [Roseivirga sp. BDSF3-8]|uniref:fumarylacetoacetase n=1 Tax=Roseivirga sp. BDSF3-8 TaxID=3241598 RepID=UPI003531D84C
MTLKANDPSRKSWVTVEPNSDFPIQNLPFGVFRVSGGDARIGVAIGEYVLDLAAVQEAGYFNIGQLPAGIFKNQYLNPFMELGKAITRDVRERVSQLLLDSNDELASAPGVYDKFLLKQADVEMLMPVFVRDYTDFYSSREHATNVGTMFRGKDNALMPNWLHLPVGYHGRASSIVVSGTPTKRPKGQTKNDDEEQPSFGPTKRLDFELEMAFITSQATAMGESIAADEAENYIFGMVLFNDWSARDIQKWEYVPLGPFLGKNFSSVVSPWVVTMDALEPFRVAGPEQRPEPLPYLKTSGKKNIDIDLEVGIQPDGGEEKVVCHSNFKHMYWNINQQLAHHTVNGCNIGVGDMYASGTISGPEESAFGSMLEIAWKGTKPVQMPDGTERRFIHDGDTVIMRGHCEKDGLRIGFGEVRSKVLPAE